MTDNRPCDDCNACCVWPAGEVHNIKFGNGMPCQFLNKVCSIYASRPKMCHNFQCAWSQHLFPEWMRPDKCGVLMYFENWTNGQYLLAIETVGKMSNEILVEIENFVKKHECPAVIQNNGSFFIHGSKEFIEEMNINKNL